MRLQEILSAVPGLEKRFVHYLEGQGYIKPAKLQKARIARRDYSEGDLDRIRSIWRYYQRGISVQRAYELVTRVVADGAYVLFPVPSGKWAAAIALLRSVDNVLAASAVYGETADIMAQLRAPHESDVYNVLDTLFEASIISGPPHILRYDARSTWHLGPGEGQRQDQGAEKDAERDGGASNVRAWVLIKVPAKQIGGLLEELRGYPGIVEASAIFGETDVIAKIDVDNQAALDDLVVNRIQSIQAVDSTRTFIGIGSLYWEREGP